ncbi:hypothetical protein BGZ76_001144, partial [Entomortierella beljakovae]
MDPQFIKVASLAPNQRNCNLKLRVLSVETIAETVHPDTGKIIQSAEAIVGDDTACILLNLKNDQVNLLALNARLVVLNGNVNMHRGFMRLEVNEDDENDGAGSSITAILDDEEGMERDGEKLAASSYVAGNYSHGSTTTAAAAASSSASTTATIASGSSSHSLVSATQYPNRDQLEIEMRLGTGGSVPLMEYYRTIELTYFSTVEP